MRSMFVIMLAMVAAPVTAQQTIPSDPVACDDGRIVAEGTACDIDLELPGPYIVFFPWGGTTIDRDAREIIDAAAADYASNEGLSILLSGHSDRSGPAGVNQRISRQRAAAVRQALEERGVPSSAIDIEVQGESALLIGTSDGVREAQNRRVEILFSRPAD